MSERSPKRQMHLVAYLKTGPTARHVGGWRHPEARLDDFLRPDRYVDTARMLEAAKFDGCFFADPDKVHYANYEGKLVRTRGPLSVPRSAQGRPVLMQAGSSDRGREFAARWAEVIFTAQRGIDDMRDFAADIRERMQARGRAPGDCAILPAISVVLGETESIARERAEYLESLIDPELATANSSSRLGADLTKVRDGRTLAAAQGNQGIRGAELVLEQAMKAEGLTLAEAARKGGEREIVGTATMVADRLEEMFTSGACDGFVVAPTYHPGMLEQFCRSVVPELQRRGLFRQDFRATTLRGHLRDG